MAAMRAVGNGHRFPAHAIVREDACEYVIELPDDADADHVEIVFKPRALEIHVPRSRIERRAVPIEGGAYVPYRDAQGC